jgi:hypothetical protein
MKKIRALQIAGAINQTGRGHIPQIDRPQAQRKNQSVGTQAAVG